MEKRIVVDVLGREDATIHPIDQPLLYGDELAAIRGDGIFETMMFRQGTVQNFHHHQQRFLRSAQRIDLPQPDMERWNIATEVALQHYRDLQQTAQGEDKDALSQEWALRWIYSRGRESTGRPSGWITLNPIEPSILKAREEGVRVMTAERGYHIDFSARSPWALIGAKTLSYAANMAALRYAKSQGFDDVIFLSEEGKVLEGPTSSIVVLSEGALLTPPHKEGILPGTTQAALFDLAHKEGYECHYRTLDVEDLRTAQGVWLVSSVRLAARVTAIDGSSLPEPSQDIAPLVIRAAAGEKVGASETGDKELK